MATQVALAATAGHKRYIARGKNQLHTIFENHFSEFCDQYDERFAQKYGRFRLRRIESVAERFGTCGDYRHGVARIRCTNPECGHDHFRPFSCKGFYLCPSCSQKRTLLFAEHLTDEVLLNLPHRQFVFALPKALRIFFRHDRRLFGHVSRLIYHIIQEFYHQAAGRPIRTGVVIAHQTFGDMLRWNPHFHAIVLEGGFDEQGTFVYIPLGHLQAMTELLRRRVVALLVDQKLLDRRFARNMLSWRHSGFSINNSVRILDRGVQRSLAEYISRPAISLKKIRYEPFKGRVLFHTTYSDYFKENVHLFDALDFLAELTQHIPPARVQLIRRYGLYSSRIKGHWTRMPYVLQRAPSGWTSQNDQNAATASNRAGSPEVPATETDAPDARERRHAWARLLARVYEVDALVCPRCGARLRVIAVIQNPVQIKKILNHLVRTGRAPPGLDPGVNAQGIWLGSRGTST